MSQIYPKRILNVVSSFMFILVLGTFVKTTLEFREDYYNLTEIDKYIHISILLFLILTIASSIGLFYKKTWSWVGLASYLVYSIIGFLNISNENNQKAFWIIVIPAGLILVVLTIFLFSNNVRNYLNINSKQFVTTLIFPILFFTFCSIDVVPNKSRVNSYYIYTKGEKYYFQESIFSGTIFLNHPNGYLSLEGAIKDGLEEGTWRYFNENKVLAQEVQYEKGLENGKSISYFPSGEIREEKNYVKGALHGNYKKWLTPTKIITTGNYNFGLKHGEWKNYDGTKYIRIETFENGISKNISTSELN